jgi:hypothetical protein
VGAQLLSRLLALEFSKVNFGKVCEASDNVLSDQRLGILAVTLLRHLNLKLASAKVKIENLFDTGGFGRGLCHFVLGDLVTSSDTEINATLRDKGRNVGGGQEDERDGEVLDQGNVEARVSVELNVGAVEKIKTCLVKTAL